MGTRTRTHSLLILLCILGSSCSGPLAIYRFKRDADCTTSAANFNDAFKSVTKAQDVREDIALMMKPFASWEEFLMPAPISIAILGELAAISSASGDFSINLNPPACGFKHMKYPESFAATLMQICIKSWVSFSTANKNMDRIRLLTGAMPRATKEIVTILFQPTATINALLPQRLDAYLSTANECTSLVQSVEASFANTIHLIQEVLQACVNSKWGYEKKLGDVKIDPQTARNMLIKGLDSLVRVKEQWEKMKLFFQMISYLTESNLSKDVNLLVESVKLVQSLPNYSSDAFVKDMLYIRASKASHTAHLVHMISSTYCEVSQRYMMDHMSALGRLITMRPSSPEFMVEREKLQSGCTEALTSIQALVISKKQEFDLSIEERVNKINCQLAAAIPPMSAEEKKRISEAVNAGARAAKGSSNTDLGISEFF